ncbi:unnamed protein product [Didymodactylos carnosus]|uniref:Uncharacterized protein n=1 Tax=Didymodactylos carnosus TaxID=1234261 RepID=A0A814K536_9BILA|nr:unnamed protein product [Didymodactylos carnosus]CAF1046367.1 unnamed protein product [Didymodactylos carnosus]CAF3653299.1 unnamed protein product [Didymodactylos carnosus]CAF3816166.1 unnamed protein product [Didymodactylos carnosus]
MSRCELFIQLLKMLDNEQIDFARELLANNNLKNKELFEYHDQDGNTLLHRYLVKNKPEIVRFLIYNGAEVNVLNKDGWLPFHLAVFCSADINILQCIVDASHGKYTR